jgi:general secretion pathway protein D
MMNGAGAPAPSAIVGAGFNPNNDVAAQSLGRSVDDTFGVDRRLNAIVLHGSPDRIARLKAKIAKIDVPVTSVILETVFVELTQSGAKNVGLDFNNANSQIATAAYTSGDYLSLGGGSHGVGSVSLQAAIYAQVQQGRGRIISRPRISAQSGTTAKIVTGDALPILTAITLSGVNGVSQQVQYVTVGVTLQIAPRVSDDGFVTSHVFCEVSSVTGYSQGYPTISQREASTSATVRDGESFVIGGLTEENELSTNGKVPVAGDVPLVGRLFQLHRTTSSKTELYIVVTPHIVGGALDLAEARRDRQLALRPDAATSSAR